MYESQELHVVRLFPSSCYILIQISKPTQHTEFRFTPVNFVMRVHTILLLSLHNLSTWQYNKQYCYLQDPASNYNITVQEKLTANQPSNCTAHADCTSQCGETSPPIQQLQTNTDSNAVYSHVSKNITVIMSVSSNNNCCIWIILLFYVITPHQI